MIDVIEVVLHFISISCFSLLAVLSLLVAAQPIRRK